MDEMQTRIVRLLGRRGPLSHSQLYQKLYRYRAQKKNDAIEKLMSAGLIKQDLIRLNPSSKKPARYLSLTLFGHDFFMKMGKDKNL